MDFFKTAKLRAKLYTNNYISKTKNERESLPLQIEKPKYNKPKHNFFY